jgi:hypothetical protein
MNRFRFEDLQDEGARLLKWVFWIGVTLLLVLYPRAVSAGTIKLAWDPVGDTDLAGYRVYYGTTSGLYSQAVEVGKQTTATLTNLQDCRVYYLALKSVDANGNESLGFSNEISGFPAPQPSTVSPASAKQATGNLNITIGGTNFDTQAQPDFGPDVTVNSYSTVSCSQMLASISIDPAARVNSAPALPRVLTVRNQGGPLGQASGTFTVLFDERRADIDGSGKVAARDLLYWQTAFGSRTGDPAYNIDADLNGDGIVDGADLSLLAVWHGTQFF